MHELYRVFASGIVLPSKLEINDSEDEIKQNKEVAKAYKEYQKSIETAKNKYRDMVSGRTRWPNDMERVELLHKLAWMEHRRWNAFTRVQGFKGTKAYAVYAEARSYKEMDVKLHPCLVECNQKGILIASDEERYVGVGPILLCSDAADKDFLDELSYDLRDKKYNSHDFKLYDYPMVEQTILDSIELPDGCFEAIRQQVAKNSPEKSGEEFEKEVAAQITQHKMAYALGYKIKLIL